MAPTFVLSIQRGVFSPVLFKVDFNASSVRRPVYGVKEVLDGLGNGRGNLTNLLASHCESRTSSQKGG